MAERSRRLALHAPNSLTALAISGDQRHLVTASWYSAFDFAPGAGRCPASGGGRPRPTRLERRTRGSVKTCDAAPLLDSQSDAELAVTCSRTCCQLTSSMTSGPAGGYGVTCLALCGASSLVAVCLSSVAPTTSSSVTSSASPSSSSSAAAASAASVVVAVCERERLETLWLCDDLLSASCIHDAVFHGLASACPRLFVLTDTTVHLLHAADPLNTTSQLLTGAMD